MIMTMPSSALLCLLLAHAHASLVPPAGTSTRVARSPAITANPALVDSDPHSDRAQIGTLDVPHLAIGTISWTPNDEADEARLAATAHASLGAGLDLFDTAERYGARGKDLIPAALNAVAKSVGIPVGKTYQGGDCESNLARWAPGATVITKFTPKPDRNTASSVVDTCRESARRMGVEQLPLYQIHMPDIIQPLRAFGLEERRDEIFWDGLAECYHEGLAANVGVSNYGPTLMARAQEALGKRGVPLASNQICLNLLTRRQGNLATVEACAELGVACLAYYPLAMGLLTGKLTPSALRGRKDTRSRELLRYLEGGAPEPFEWPATAGVVPDGGMQPLLTVLQQVAASNAKTPAQVALNWIVCKVRSVSARVAAAAPPPAAHALRRQLARRLHSHAIRMVSQPGRARLSPASRPPLARLSPASRLLSPTGRRASSHPPSLPPCSVCRLPSSPQGAIPISGVSSAHNVGENAGALGWRLSADDVALLDTAADTLPFEFAGSGFQTTDSKFVGYGFERWRLD